MTDRVAYPLLDERLSWRGWARVGPQGELSVELEVGIRVVVPSSDAAELAVAILKRARPEYRLFDVSELTNVREMLDGLLEEDGP